MTNWWEQEHAELPGPGLQLLQLPLCAYVLKWIILVTLLCAAPAAQWPSKHLRHNASSAAGQPPGVSDCSWS